ncbi:MAG: GrpB family protein, partial [Acidobacteria bacterium]|nr:GrpB family protein [Acidobacteriota bacterium]
MESTDQRVARVLKENIVIAPYDARWPEMFRQEVAHLRAVLPAELVGR